MLRADIRSLTPDSTWDGYCKVCGAPLVVMSDDRRNGCCFDCLDLLDVPYRK